MITPNKVVTLENSALGMVAVILNQGPDMIKLMELYHRVSDNFESVEQFLLTMDILYVLGRVQVNFQTGTVSYVS
ncbi:MAG: hypothetical protein A4E65_03818 [Syntrophorhabdus sp. PtaU1.Bin153]|nr:MAG: hypothetical protein A4E65_03818 [Syntrophorhabdus sp. PtaU1.Bin153]